AGGRAYYRPDWQGVRRRAPRVVRDAGETVRASLVVLGRVLEDHVVLAADGRVLDTPSAPADPLEVTPLAPEIVAGLTAMVVATSARALGPWLVAAARRVEFAGGPGARDRRGATRARLALSPPPPRTRARAARPRARPRAL